MIYAYLLPHAKALEKVKSLEAILKTKQPDAGYFVIDEQNFSSSVFGELTESQGLFSRRYLVRVEGNFSKPEKKELFKEVIPLMAQSENIFILLTEDVDVPTKKLLEKHAEKIIEQKNPLQKEEDSKGYNLFRMTDAFGERDTTRLFSLYQEAKGQGVTDEEIHGLLCWHYRQMQFATKESSAEDAGMKSFIYTKAKRHARNFSAGELATIGTLLTSMNHDDRRGLYDLETSLELFTLTLSNGSV